MDEMATLQIPIIGTWEQAQMKNTKQYQIQWKYQQHISQPKIIENI